MDDIDKLRVKILNSETFCFYPFLEISTNPSGHVKPCCYYTDVLFKDPAVKSYDAIHNISNNETIEDVWNSAAMVQIRESMKNGQKLLNCDVCYRDKDASMRVRGINEYKNNTKVLELVNDTMKNTGIANHLPLRLELKPSNLCNLKCVMCNSYDSSQVAKELTELVSKFKGIEVRAGRFEKISDTLGITENNLAFNGINIPDWSTNKEIWDSFERIVPSLEVLSFAGGEPTLIPFVDQALRYCVETGHAQHITVFISSNFSNLNKSFLEMMPNFRKFELIASFDGIGLVNDYCRYPSKWSHISANYLAAKRLMVHSNIKILINITVNLLNVMDLTDLLWWIDDMSTKRPYYNEWPYNINLIWQPSDQRIENLPNEYKVLAISKLEQYKQGSVVLKEFPQLGHKIDLVINALNSDAPPTKIDQFKNRISVLDAHRGISIKNYIPSIGELFNE